MTRQSRMSTRSTMSVKMTAKVNAGADWIYSADLSDSSKTYFS